MINFVCLQKRRKGVSFEQFEHYYENHHAKLANSYLTKVLHYQRRYLTLAMPGYLESGDDVPGRYGCFTEIWFENRADMEANPAMLTHPDMAKIIIVDEECRLPLPA